MSFILQPQGDKKCGAYCIAYWEWIVIKSMIPSKGGLDEKEREDQEKYIDKIYSKIMFDKPDAEDLNIDPQFSDPKKMIIYLRGLEDHEQKRTCLFNKSRELETKFGKHLEGYYENCFDRNLPDLNVGSYAILILLDNLYGCPQHYVLVKKDDIDKVKVIDPSGINWLDKSWHDIDSINIPGFINSGAAIYIN